MFNKLLEGHVIRPYRYKEKTDRPLKPAYSKKYNKYIAMAIVGGFTVLVLAVLYFSGVF